MSVSTERTPRITFSRIGKKDSSATMMIFEVIPNPNQMMNSGIRATLGTTCEATITGRIACSSQATRPSTIPRASPRTSAIAEADQRLPPA